MVFGNALDLNDIYIDPEHTLDPERYFAAIRQIKLNSGHLTLFNLEPSNIEQMDGYLNEILDYVL